MLLFVWTYFSFQIPKIYILLWFFDYNNMSTLMFQQLFHTFFRNAATSKFVWGAIFHFYVSQRQGQDHWLPKFFGEGNFVDLKLFLPGFVAVNTTYYCSNWMAKGQGCKGPRARFISGSSLQLICVLQSQTTLSDTLCCKTNLIQTVKLHQFHAISWGPSRRIFWSCDPLAFRVFCTDSLLDRKSDLVGIIVWCGSKLTQRQRPSLQWHALWCADSGVSGSNHK